jgi:uncharacterized protein (TIGR00296 family)
MLSLKEGAAAVTLARQVIEAYIQKKPLPSLSPYRGLFNDKQGVFVTLHSHPGQLLRGCIGYPLPDLPLKKAIFEAAISAATQDPRFPPVDKAELEHIQIEVTVLSVPEKIVVTQPKEYLNQITIGRDGLIAEHGFFKGLLLPQVPVEQNWDVEEFLSNTCMKAGLPPDAWVDTETVIKKFSGQIFTEKKPRGEIEEKKINGSCN